MMCKFNITSEFIWKIRRCQLNKVKHYELKLLKKKSNVFVIHRIANVLLHFEIFVRNYIISCV